MLVAYSDESGVGNIKKEPITVVTAVVINMDSQWSRVESDLIRARRSAPKRFLEKRALKGKLLYQALRKGDSDAAATLEKVLSIPPNRGLVILYGAVDRLGFRQSNGRSFARIEEFDRSRAECDEAFRQCLERVSRIAKSFAEHQRVLWIAHRAGTVREPAMKVEHFWHRLHGGIVLEGDPPRVTSGGPSAIVDTIYFGNDQDSIALQLADVCCSTVTLKLLERFYRRSPCVEPYYEKIRLSVMNDGVPPSWVPGSP